MKLLVVKNLRKSFGGVRAVDDVSFSIEENKITSLIGPNGAGKTTVFNVISGLVKPDLGSISFRGKEISGLSPHKIAIFGISRTFQLTRVFKNLKVSDNLSLASKARVQEALEMVGLKKELLSRKAGELSYGQQRLLEIARSLVFPHKLLMLDEPTAGVNPSVRGKLKEILLEAKAKGDTILLIEHDMDFVMDLSDRVIVLNEGRLLCEGKPEIVRKDKRVLEAYLGK